MQSQTSFSSDKILWETFKQGDKKAFAMIYEQYIQALLNYGHKITQDESLIEDSIQDLFYELWNSKSKLAETDSIKFYLFKALRNKIYRNKEKNNFDVIDENQPLPDWLSEVSTEYSIILQEHEESQLSHLKKAIQKLPKRQQEAINLRFFHDFSNEEVAQLMGVNYQSACKFIYTGLRFLKEHIIYPILVVLITSYFEKF
ncbi:sigma-70 family RNA polymerase sigma factor [Arcicella aquatica]|uniref:Sigma-70 family RNA polymerase sigma factor n=1 Tax=Arcicella aquatica TaxID=217141 RepID=A0ABU5QI07_9BACT|nr:sigma-70 family RNA polymerase sigma factor [Arcicella aquatica]MEA5256691.1 sigma-70 family RNA polymerase sigma factor [Arcicella aquatica]